MNKKIAMSAVSIFSALAIMGGATFAAFTDNVTQTGNTFASGNANLEIASDLNGAVSGSFGSTIPGANFSGVLPGQSKTFFFWLKNTSTATLNLDLTADVTAINDANDANQEMDNALLVSWTCDTDNNNSLDNNTGSTPFSPRDFLNNGNVSLGVITPGDEMFCKMVGTLPIDAPAGAANETMSFDVMYGGVQASP